MSAKNKRIKPEPIRTVVDFKLHVDRCTYIDTELTRLRAERALAIVEAEKTHVSEIADYEAELKLKSMMCLAFATEERKTILPGTAKSARTFHSVFGFRMGNDKLSTLYGWSWKKVLAEIQSRNLLSIIKVKPSVDKAAIIKEAKDSGVITLRDGCNDSGIEIPLADLGLKMKRTEGFFMEPLAKTGEKESS